MKEIKFTTSEGDTISISHSSSVNEMYRIYLEGEQFKEQDDGLGNKIPVCLHLSRNQAEILISGLQDLFKDNE
jgi:hypothetical protein